MTTEKKVRKGTGDNTNSISNSIFNNAYT